MLAPSQQLHPNHRSSTSNIKSFSIFYLSMVITFRSCSNWSQYAGTLGSQDFDLQVYILKLPGFSVLCPLGRKPVEPCQNPFSLGHDLETTQEIIWDRTHFIFSLSGTVETYKIRTFVSTFILHGIRKRPNRGRHYSCLPKEQASLTFNLLSS